ncbi:MAG TPA: O-antigen ligase family protein [Solirubrobacterales bacterium]|nr:O-antigen ligase family protein [Solirubrobacterales bacterium]
MNAVSAEFRRTQLGLLAAALLAPLSATHLAGPLTVGRAAVLLFAALLGADLFSARPRDFRPDLPTSMLVIGYLGLCGWALLSTRTTGCNCEGKAGGLFELSAIGLMAVVAIGFEPRLRDGALLASLTGLTLAGGLALVGVGSINSATVDLTDTGGRLSGTYGNANELALAVALGVPVALAYLSVAAHRMRLLLATSVALLLAALVLTYSRGGIIAAGVGVLALALWSARGSRRRVALVLTAAVLAAALGGALYSVFKTQREDASFAAVPTGLVPLSQRDVSGWDARQLGPIPAGPSHLANGTGGIVVSSGGGEGMSFGLGEAKAGRTYRLSLSARAGRRGTRLDYALGDRVAGGGARASARLDRGWQTLTLLWRPAADAPHASLFLWLPGRPGSVTLASARVTESDGEAVLGAVVAPARLRGSVYRHLGSDGPQLERHYVESRLDAARLALRAFGSAPVLGIGWSTFPEYSAAHGDYGRLAAHDQYLLIAAELGLIGLAFLALLVLAPVLAVRGARRDRATAAAIGVLATAAAGMFFVEPLSSPQVSIPIALAAAVLCANLRPGQPQSERTSSATSEPPLREASEAK